VLRGIKVRKVRLEARERRVTKDSKGSKARLDQLVTLDSREPLELLVSKDPLD